MLWRGRLDRFPIGAQPPLPPVFVDTPYNQYAGGSLRIVADPQQGRALSAQGTANEGRDGTQRAEAVPTVRVTEGDVVFVQFDLWASPDLAVASRFQGPFQMKSGVESGGEGYGPVGLTVGGNGHDYVEVTDGSGTQAHVIGAIPRGRWTRLVVGVRIEKDSDEAWVEAWRDGENVLPRTESWATRDADGSSGGTMTQSGAYNYFKFGLYRGAPQPAPAEFRFANMVIFRGR